jgi:hypothetical protein
MAWYHPLNQTTGWRCGLSQVLDVLPYGLTSQLTRGSRVERLSPGYIRLSIPIGPAGWYRLAQLGNYDNLKRLDFHHGPPLEMSLEARSSEAILPGTWGFGLWNDPFGMGVLAGGGLRLPSLPNAAWFFFASPENYLSLRDDLPAHGGLGAAFQSPRWPGWRIALAAPGFGLLAIPPAARWLRRLGRGIIRQDAASIEIDPTSWHTYHLDWTAQSVYFWIDGRLLLQTGVIPQGRLGLVIWIDNQYAAFPSDGRLRHGQLENLQPAWIEIRGLKVDQGCPKVL